ncbi:peroxidasin isoform X2 [Lingula anatina]|uniref:Peroxidasin isoform X2 n=1 Tax=Lingula anatina TaxID=7574 RepID=A0A1S3IIM0_LINAN|nr:peroxidasin isoform X2 [Lingula anatina]|eukprot:XP_013398080.1 peroxidasin isoform X2 [Lingula anatina]
MAWKLLLYLALLFHSSIAQPCPSRCLCFRTTVRCMFLHLEKIPQVPPETTILDLRFNKIEHIPPNSFTGLTHLNTLLLNNNHIKTLEDGAFEGIAELRYLYLYKNNIENISSNAFKGLDNLEQLFLHNNALKRLPRGVFAPLKNLRRLRLDSNALVCDCQMMWLAEMLKDKRGSTQAAATCEYPAKLQGKSIMSVEKGDFHCKKPVLTREPTDVDITFGNTVYLQCRADGDPNPEITWIHNDNEIPTTAAAENDRYKLLEDGTLMIKSAQDVDQGIYECMARNEAGEVKSHKAEVRYFRRQPAAPTFISRPEDYDAVEHENVRLDCTSSGYPRPETRWFKGTALVERNARYTILPGGSLMITDIRKSDRGDYKCEVRNAQATISATARLNVRVIPSITSLPSDQVVVEGEVVRFTCEADGYPEPTIRWTKDGRPLPDTGKHQVLNRGRELRISRVGQEDRGSYECHAESELGRKNAAAVLLIRERVPPTFTQTPTDVTQEAFTNAELRCQADGDPIPRVIWARHGQRIDPDDRFLYRSNGILTIHNATEADSGIYECTAENSVGSISAVARVTITPAPRAYVGDRFVQNSVQQAIRGVDNAINQTLSELFDKNRRRTPNDLLTIFRLPTREALQISRAAEVFERTLEIIHEHIDRGHHFDESNHEIPYDRLVSPAQLTIIANLSGCLAHRRIINCTDMCFHHKYRSMDGTCNNLQHPMWGASLTGFKRLLPPAYENNFNTPVGWEVGKLYHGYPKPSARLISTKVIAAKRPVVQDEKHTTMLMQWGQFMDHDIDLAPMALSFARFSDGRHCNETCENKAPCFPIPVPANDARIHRHECMGVTRSSSMCGTGTTSILFNKVVPREQINQITSFIDGSQIYGSSEEEAGDLREFSSQRGLLRIGERMPGGKELLPPALHTPVDCQIDPERGNVPCYLAGDHRANEQLALLSMHTLWMREHNRIAAELLRLNPHWDGDMLYHEARKIVGAELQHITYKHWLPKFLGRRGMEMLGPYTGYDPNVDASVTNDFTTSALRVGHTMVNPIIYRFDANYTEIPQGHLPLHKAFFAPFRLVEEGGVDPILRGLIGTPAKKLTSDGILNLELTEKLFKLAHEVALDLAAINIQRGRDHGLPSYNEYRKMCNLTEASAFSDLRNEIRSPELRRKLQEVYGHPGNIDVWVGGVSEDPVDGAKMGPTFLCILVEQFRRLRAGDRFWYENPGVFKPAQLVQIKQTSLARTLCDNGDNIDSVPEDVFIQEVFPSGFKKCSKINGMDLKLWTDCCTDCSKSGEFNSLLSHYRKRRSAEFSYAEEKFHKQSNNEVIESMQFSKEEQPVESEKIKYNVDISQNAMDIFDSRIEGMEEAIDELQHMMEKMKKKIRRLERTLKNPHCVDGQGNKRKSREKWNEGDCKYCECKHGQKECHRIICPQPGCATPKIVQGHCCPVCE